MSLEQRSSKPFNLTSRKKESIPWLELTLGPSPARILEVALARGGLIEKKTQTPRQSPFSKCADVAYKFTAAPGRHTAMLRAEIRPHGKPRRRFRGHGFGARRGCSSGRQETAILSMR